MDRHHGLRPNRAPGHLERLRAVEVSVVAGLLPPSGRILDFGAGDGFQASLLCQRGFEVAAVDAAPSQPQYHPVVRMGSIPLSYGASTFDVFFSSNVLEHIADLSSVLCEGQRLLRSGGVQVHVMPTATWRAVTALSFYPAQARRLLRRQRGLERPTLRAAEGLVATSVVDPFRRLVRELHPGPHGEFNSAAEELWAFSRLAWRARFRRAGFRVVRDMGCGLLYTGDELMPGLPLLVRALGARFFGSSTRVYEIKPTQAFGGGNIADNG